MKHGRLRAKTFHVMNNVKPSERRPLQGALCSCGLAKEEEEKRCEEQEKQGKEKKCEEKEQEKKCEEKKKCEEEEGEESQASSQEREEGSAEHGERVLEQAIKAKVEATLQQLKQPLNQADQQWLCSSPEWQRAVRRYVERKYFAKHHMSADPEAKQKAAAKAAAAAAAAEEERKKKLVKQVLVPIQISHDIVGQVIGKRGIHLQSLARTNAVHIQLQYHGPAAGSAAPRRLRDVTHLYISSVFTELTKAKVDTIHNAVLARLGAAIAAHARSAETKKIRQQMQMQISQPGDIRRHGRDNGVNVKILNRRKFERRAKQQQRPKKPDLLPYTYCRYCLKHWGSIEAGSECHCHPGFVTRTNTWSCCKSAVMLDAYGAADPLMHACAMVPHQPKLSFPKETLKAKPFSPANARSPRMSGKKQRQELSMELRAGLVFA